jgi:hypothetical protein
MLKIAAVTALAGALCIAAAHLGATASVEQSVPQRALKGDRLPIGPACSQAAWPNYESKCVRDTTRPQGEPRQVRVVRIISTDGLAGRQPVVSFAN